MPHFHFSLASYRISYGFCLSYILGYIFSVHCIFFIACLRDGERNKNWRIYFYFHGLNAGWLFGNVSGFTLRRNCSPSEACKTVVCAWFIFNELASNQVKWISKLLNFAFFDWSPARCVSFWAEVQKIIHFFWCLFLAMKGSLCDDRYTVYGVLHVTWNIFIRYMLLICKTIKVMRRLLWKIFLMPLRWYVKFQNNPNTEIWLD